MTKNNNNGNGNLFGADFDRADLIIEEVHTIPEKGCVARLQDGWLLIVTEPELAHYFIPGRVVRLKRDDFSIADYTYVVHDLNYGPRLGGSLMKVPSKDWRLMTWGEAFPIEIEDDEDE